MASKQLDEGRGNTFVLVKAERPDDVAGNRSDLIAASGVLTTVKRLRSVATTQSLAFKLAPAISASVFDLR